VPHLFHGDRIDGGRGVDLSPDEPRDALRNDLLYWIARSLNSANSFESENSVFAIHRLA